MCPKYNFELYSSFENSSSLETLWLAKHFFLPQDFPPLLGRSHSTQVFYWKNTPSFRFVSRKVTVDRGLGWRSHTNSLGWQQLVLEQVWHNTVILSANRTEFGMNVYSKGNWELKEEIYCVLVQYFCTSVLPSLFHVECILGTSDWLNHLPDLYSMVIDFCCQK